MLTKKVIFILTGLAISGLSFADPIPPNPADPNEEAEDICRKYGRGQDPELRVCLADMQTELYGETGLSYGILPEDTVSDVGNLYGVSDQFASDCMYAGGGSGGGGGGGH